MDPEDIERQRSIARPDATRTRDPEPAGRAGPGRSEIAKRLVISDKTVKTHVQNILRKLDVTSRLEAAAVAIRAGYVSLSAS